jgi:hypothetical protein
MLARTSLLGAPLGPSTRSGKGFLPTWKVKKIKIKINASCYSEWTIHKVNDSIHTIQDDGRTSYYSVARQFCISVPSTVDSILEPEKSDGAKETRKTCEVIIRDEPEESDVYGVVTTVEPDVYGDRWDQLKPEQKPGVSFPHDSCSLKNLTPEFEATALTQYTLKQGLKEFGIDGITALGKEVEQLYTRKVSKPVDGDDLTREQKQASLRYLMFLTKKRCGRIKASVIDSFLHVFSLSLALCDRMDDP